MAKGKGPSWLERLGEVWETAFTGDTRTIEVHASWLRRRIELDSSSPRLIHTVRGMGYVFREE